MFAHSEGIDPRRARKVHLWLVTGILLGITLVKMLIGRTGPASRDQVMAMASVAALGTFAIGWMNTRVSPYPRWAWLASAGIMGMAFLVSAAVIDPIVWKKEIYLSGWMLPWLLVTMGVTPSSKSGMCAPTHWRAGWIMIVMSLFLSAILLGAHVIADRI